LKPLPAAGLLALPIQHCSTVHKLRNLVAHAPKKLAEEIAADYY